jgi:hypothetical protein
MGTVFDDGSERDETDCSTLVRFAILTLMNIGLLTSGILKI